MAFRKLPPVLLGCLLAVAFAAPASAYAPFQTGLHDPSAGDGAALPFDRARDAGASIARTAVYWFSIAPGGETKPGDFDARNPADPRYNWTQLDRFVRAAAARDIEPLITVYGAPTWAEGYDAADRARRFGDPGAYRPNPDDFRDFMHAAATRYSGTFTDPETPYASLPRVKYWQIWNEPNFGQYLVSQRSADIPGVYKRLLNAGYDAVKGVRSSNVVLAAGLGPYGNNQRATDQEPQLFMRSLMCLSGVAGSRLKDRGCSGPPPKFDIWTQHPYTLAGTPTTDAGAPDSAVIGDMDQIKRTLDFAVRKRNVAPRGRKRLWVTEFGWFSNPPGLVTGEGRQIGLPFSRHAAYLSESAYRLWRDGFSAMVWYGLDDLGGFPTGLYHGSGESAKPKPALTAFKFPFFADAQGRRVLVWGLVSRGGKTTVRVERRSGSRWRRVADVFSDSRGMIYTRLRGGRGTYRARALTGAKSGAESLPFKAR